jgi:16S rRNA (cytosine1402-N4)-methyltransferase
MKHISVLLNETIDGLNIKSGSIVVDGTLGGGGHTLEMIKRWGNKIKIIGLDLDKDAIDRTKILTDDLDCDIVFRNSGFQDIDKALEGLNIPHVDGILLDLGISSFQLEESNRGFTFQKDEPLYMTMKKEPTIEDLTAHDIVNTWGEETLADIIYGFGEERYSRKIAKAIVLARKDKEIKTTFDLVEIIEKVVGKNYKGKKIHPATKTFQALRIATNSEFTNIENVIEKGFKKLSNGGRFSIITFHSLEDRIVKHLFSNLQKEGLAKVINKKPIIPSDEEIKLNPRSRSAKLRLLEKIKI